MRHVAAVMVCLSFAILTLAQDAKWDPPAAPEGWKAVAGHDGRYWVAFPKNARSYGTRDRTIKTGLRTLFKYTYATSRDGIMFDSGWATLSAADMRGKTIDQALDAFVDLEKGRFTVSGPKEVTVAGYKAREYRLTNDKVSRRLVVFGVTPRIFVAEVSAADASKLDGDAAEAFFKSFVLVPEAVVKASVKDKERPEKPGLTDQESVAKYGAKWTRDLKEMTPPDAPAVGVIRGREFKPDSVTLERTGRLTFRQGSGTVPDMEVDLVFVVKPRETAENRTIEIGEGRRPQFTPLVRLTTQQEGKKVAMPESFPWNYSLKLTLGAKGKDGSIPGTIYLCTPDAARSFFAGKFTAKEK